MMIEEMTVLIYWLLAKVMFLILAYWWVHCIITLFHSVQPASEGGVSPPPTQENGDDGKKGTSSTTTPTNGE